MRTLLAAVAIVLPLPALAGYAIFPPGGQRLAAGDPVAIRIVQRATAALDRPPGAIPRLHTEGTLPGHGIRDISIAAKRDQPITLDLSLAWTITGDRRFLDQAARYLTAWAGTYRISFNPIDETGFDTMLMATDLVGPDLSPTVRSRLAGFWRGMATGYLDAMEGAPKNAHTNWQSHRIKLATMAAYITGDARLIARARAAYRKQLSANLRPDGSTFDFEERDALHYVTYNLDPLMMAAISARAHGNDWFALSAPSGASLSRSLNWFAAFARGERTHIEFARSKIAFDRERAASGQAEYAPHAWDPAGAVNTYALATLLAPDYAPLAATLARSTGRPPADWIAVLRAQRP